MSSPTLHVKPFLRYGERQIAKIAFSLDLALLSFALNNLCLVKSELMILSGSGPDDGGSMP